MQITEMEMIQLKSLWKEMFAEEDQFLDVFFSHQKEIQILVERRENQIVSALYMVPYEYVTKKKRLKCMYLYALATKKEYQRQGIMTLLLHRAMEYAQLHMYEFCFLIPASESLISFYKKRGYVLQGSTNCYRIDKDLFLIFLNQNQWNPISTEEFLKIQNTENIEEGFVMNSEIADIFLQSCKIYGGQIYQKDGQYLFGYEEDGMVRCYSNYELPFQKETESIYGTKELDIRNQMQNVEFLLR